MLTRADEKLIHALQSRRGREKHGLFLAEGVRVVEELLASRVSLKFAAAATTLGDSQRGRELLQALRLVTQVREVSDGELNAIAATEAPQGIIAVGEIPVRTLADVRLASRSIVLLLDAVQDPGNLGTLIRSADAFAAVAVIALPGTADYWNPKVVRSAAGAAFRMPLIAAADEEVWSWLTAEDFAICGADMDGQPVQLLHIDGRVALIVGNEGAGLRDHTREMLTHVVSIPMPGHAESLNVGVAAGILLYEFSRRV